MKLFITIILIIEINISFGQWEQQTFPTNEFLIKVRFFNQQTGWVLGTNYIYKTSDGGLNWSNQNSHSGYGALFVMNSDTVFYSSENSTYSYIIQRTQNGGTYWEVVDSSGFFINEIEFVNNQIGYAVGGSSTDPGIMKTTNGGTTWNLLPDSFIPEGWEITGVSFLDSLQGWVVSYRGFIYQTTNGGSTWLLQDSIRQNNSPLGWLPLRDIEFTTSDSGWTAGGISGFAYIAQTIDGGYSWSDSIVGGGSIREIHFLDSYTGWTAGSYNCPFYIYHTKNGGMNWHGQNISSFESNITGVESLSMINNDLGWAVGDDGIYKTTSGNVVRINEQTNKDVHPLSEFLLKQNYPNPFNPITTIDYTLKEAVDVKLVIFNILGQEIQTLVNKFQKSGDYTVNFNANNLSSGIYFYKLQVGEKIVKTKKMILMR